MGGKLGRFFNSRVAGQSLVKEVICGSRQRGGGRKSLTFLADSSRDLLSATTRWLYATLSSWA